MYYRSGFYSPLQVQGNLKVCSPRMPRPLESCKGATFWLLSLCLFSMCNFEWHCKKLRYILWLPWFCQNRAPALHETSANFKQSIKSILCELKPVWGCKCLLVTENSEMVILCITYWYFFVSDPNQQQSLNSFCFAHFSGGFCIFTLHNL